MEKSAGGLNKDYFGIGDSSILKEGNKGGWNVGLMLL